MADNKLARKMKIKPGTRMAVVNPPDGYLKELDPLPDGVEVKEQLKGEFDWVQVFVKNKAELDKLAPKAIAALKPGSLLWISFPKGSSKIQTDLTRDKGWDTVQQAAIKWINLISVNETWSAFGVRPYKPGEERQRSDNLLASRK